MKAVLAIVMVWALLLMVGCRQEPSVVGRWSTNFMGYDAAVLLNQDKTAEIKVEVDTPFGKAKGDASGTYTYQENKLVVLLKNVKITGVPEMVADKAKGMVQDQIGDRISGAVTWTNNDQFTVTRSDGQNATLARQKTDS